MRNVWPVILMLAIALPACNSDDSGKEKSKDSEASASAPTVSPDRQDQRFARAESPEANETKARELVNSLTSELQKDLAVLKSEIDAAETDKQKLAAYAKLNPVPAFVSDVLKTVDTFPAAGATFDGAIAGLGYARGGQRDQIMTYLLDQWPNRLNHRKIVGYLLEQIPSPKIEEWLEKVIAAAPPGVTQAEALLGYKTYFDQKPVFGTTLRKNPEVAKRISAAQLEYINAERTDNQNERIAGYLQTVIDEYSDLDFTGSGLGSSDTFGEVAKYELFELHNLNVGDIAPDIVGKDLDGADFKLSDYRGKVVMLDFWGQWCPPCRRMYPYERQMVSRLTGLPFALIGVNSDGELEKAKASVKKEKLPWRNFWNGPEGTSGPIAKLYNVSEWPTVYLIDGDGVIRFKGVLGNDIERGVEVLMAEIGHEIDLEPVTKVASRKP